MLFSQLAKITGGQIHLNQDLDVSHFSADTRTLSGQPYEVFVAINGKRDGHDFARAASERGVKNFILEKDLDLGAANKLVADDSLAAFQQIARYHRIKFSIPIIGITGSNGKTTVKEWLSTILSSRHFVVKSPKSYNSQIGVPISLLEIRENHEIGLFEAGISRSGEMKKLQEMILPTHGIFTNLGVAHDDGFDSSDHKLREKLNLFVESGKVVCRCDQEHFATISEVLRDKIIGWSLNGKGTYQVSWKDGSVQVNNDKFSTDFQSETLLENLTHAIVMALEIGLSRDQIQAGIDLIEGVPMRLELKRGVNGCYILDDSYNNDEAGLKVALDYLESHRQNERRTLILSDILHSGKGDKELYSDVSALLQNRKISRLVGVGSRISNHASLFPMETIFFDDTEALLTDLPEFREEMVVVKGARNFALERVVQRLQEKSHGTVLEVNFESLQHNLNQYRALLKPTTKLMVMVKANAYGSGLLEVANFLQHQRVDMLGVAYVDEAIQLRKNGVSLPVMIMNPYIESFEQFERYDLQAEIFSLTHLKRMLKDTKNHPGVHLKIDTGMHRLGFSKKDIPALIELLKHNPGLKVEGIFTHFSSSDMADEDDFTVSQAHLFEEAYRQLTDALGYHPIKHACNSPAMVRWPQYHFDMVRLGIGLHGFDPTGQLSLRHTSELKSTISQIQHLEAGDTVGYSRKGKIDRDSEIAIIPIGYEDGYSRIFGNGNARVSINGKLCPTIGNVCMDMIMVDVTGAGVQEGDQVMIFGANPGIQDLAKWANTIPYEILTNVSNRVKRVFISE
ncbi:MAG: bifunctional UDP-N-acetylmuramoyl-tripeptide:D-alanyl-D-alanine ligase/alanine racemase [Ekhidna sp.]|uniref:bifunctional UDP-N-acetylmuramoyl-tripeptide:D-alanyl-D-alanine ligase/alanine racemase n=1 Tax=Ekhidna sp. TaxID=2608089 RepID=UPI0032ED4A72